MNDYCFDKAADAARCIPEEHRFVERVYEVTDGKTTVYTRARNPTYGAGRAASAFGVRAVLHGPALDTAQLMAHIGDLTDDERKELAKRLREGR